MSVSYTTLHLDQLPNTGCLVIPSSLNVKELQFLEKQLGGSIAYLAEEHAKPSQALCDHLAKATHAFLFSHAESDLSSVYQELQSLITKGFRVIFIPGEVEAFSGCISTIPGHTLDCLASLKLPTLPIFVDHPRETALSFEAPSSLSPATLVFASVLDAQSVSTPAILEQLHLASNEAMEQRSYLKGSLATALYHGLRSAGAKGIWRDGSDDSELSYDKLLAVSLAFSKEIRVLTAKPRVGIILPPGKAGAIANLAVIFAGKTPVNLNFTASHEAIKSAMTQSGIDRFITADPFVRKLSEFPWPPNRDLVFLEREIPKLQKQIKRWFLANRFIPSSLIIKHLQFDERRDDDEAALLFTSGSSGDPKGVVLTHRNLLANVCQFSSRLNLPEKSKILASLPLFHSFGLTVTLLFPLIQGLTVVSFPLPTESKRLADLIEQHQVNLLLATPTFLRGYMRRVEPEKLRSLHLVVTGAEKLPLNLAQSFHERFGHFPMEGYGLTETSPVTNFNLPTPPHLEPVNPRHRIGSVGRFLAGMAVKITNPANGETLPIDQQGMIWLKGPNVFEGYLNNPAKSAEVLKEGWFMTGDIGRVDHDGFLYIEGRLSRFSKIAGEMVPHEKLEASINQVLGLDQEEIRRVAVVGVPDDKKGEAIILLSTLASRAPQQEVIDLRYKLLDAGIPSLWCPKAIMPVAEIPLLASGKLDIKGCEELAKQYHG